MSKAPDIDAMWQAFWGTVVSGCENTPVVDDNRAHLARQAGGTSAHEFGDLHEIFVPFGTGILFVWHVIYQRPVLVPASECRVT